MVASLLREAELLKMLSHPNVLQYMGMVLDEEGTLHWLVTEFANGGSLKSWLEKQFLSTGGITLQQLLNLAVWVMRGIAFLHTRGVMHRDLKVRGPLSIQPLFYSRLLDYMFPVCSIDRSPCLRQYDPSLPPLRCHCCLHLRRVWNTAKGPFSINCTFCALFFVTFLIFFFFSAQDANVLVFLDSRSGALLNVKLGDVGLARIFEVQRVVFFLLFCKKLK